MRDTERSSFPCRPENSRHARSPVAGMTSDFRIGECLIKHADFIIWNRPLQLPNKMKQKIQKYHDGIVIFHPIRPQVTWEMNTPPSTQLFPGQVWCSSRAHMRQRIIVSVDKTSITFRLEGESEDSPLHYSETSLFLAWVRRHNASLLSSTFISVEKRISDQETGLRLRQARLAANLSQVELAQRANISRSAIALWETGRKGCSLKRLTQIAHALNLDIADLISKDPSFVEKNPRKSEEHYLLSLFRKADECSRHEILRWLSTRVR